MTFLAEWIGIVTKIIVNMRMYFQHFYFKYTCRCYVQFLKNYKLTVFARTFFISKFKTRWFDVIPYALFRDFRFGRLIFNRGCLLTLCMHELILFFSVHPLTRRK